MYPEFFDKYHRIFEPGRGGVGSLYLGGESDNTIMATPLLRPVLVKWQDKRLSSLRSIENIPASRF